MNNVLSFNCFAKQQTCQRSSDLDKMLVINGESQVWRVQFHNLSTNASCQIAWRLTSSSERAHFDQVTFSVRNSQEELWEGSLQELVDQNFIMRSIFAPASTQELIFTFIFKQQGDWQLLFDLHVDLSCQETNALSSSSAASSPSVVSSSSAASSPKVIDASPSTMPIEIMGTDKSALTSVSSPISHPSVAQAMFSYLQNYWLWLCLCAFVFFVIIKLINGKKKKKWLFTPLRQQKN